MEDEETLYTKDPQDTRCKNSENIFSANKT